MLTRWTESSLINEHAFYAYALVWCLFFTGCCGLQEEYVGADRSTYEVLAPKIRYWVAEDEQLSAEAKNDYEDKLIGWEARIERAERFLEEEGDD